MDNIETIKIEIDLKYKRIIIHEYFFEKKKHSHSLYEDCKDCYNWDTLLKMNVNNFILPTLLR